MKTDRPLSDKPAGNGDKTPEARAWHDWVISKRWRVRADKGFGMADYDYAEPRVYVGSNRQGGSKVDAEHDAYVALASHLIGLRHSDDDGDLDLVREDWSLNSEGKPSKNSIDWLTTVSVAGMNQESPEWARMGSLPLTELLKRRSYPNIPDPRRDPVQREVARRGTVSIREALAELGGAMRSRRDIVSEPMTQAEYVEAKAEGWDKFGDPGRPNEPQPADWKSDECPTCGDPYCADHPTKAAGQ